MANLEMDSKFLKKLDKAQSEILACESLQDLGTVILDSIYTILNIEYCAVHVALDEVKSQWKMYASRGFPKWIVDASIYDQSQGLTGCVLNSPEGTLVYSENVEADARWSGRFRDFTWMDARHTSPVAFLGKAIHLQHRIQQEGPFAAITCLKPSTREGAAPVFDDSEREALRLLTSVASAAYEKILERDSNLRQVFDQIKRMPYPGGFASLDKVYEFILQAFHNEFLFDSLLLALVNLNRTYIDGVGVLNFDSKLMSDTHRPLLTETPRINASEDILSLICREKLWDPLEVDSQSKYYEHLNDETREAYDLKRPIWFLPLVDRMGDVFGVIHGQFTDPVRRFPWEDKTRLAVFTRHVSAILSMEIEKSRQTRERSLTEDLMASLQAGSPQDTLEKLLTGLSKHFGYSAGMVWEHNETTNRLHPACIFNLNQDVLNESLSLSRSKTEHGLAADVFHTHLPRLVSDSSQRPVNQRVRRKAGIDDEKPLIGIPLLVTDKCLGVLIVYGPDPQEYPLSQLDVYILEPFARIGALALAAVRLIQARAIYESKLVSRMRIFENITELKRDTSHHLHGSIGEWAKENALKLAKICLSMDEFLGSQICQLFLSDDPVCVETGNPELSDEDWREQNTKFYLRGAHGFSFYHVGKKFYSLGQQGGLTLTAIRELSPQSSPDVANDIRWSKTFAEVANEQFGDENALRCWLGVPIIGYYAGRRYVFGALSFTKQRDNSFDTLCFTDADVYDAELSASVLSLALVNQKVVHEFHKWHQNKIFGWFSHDRFSDTMGSVIEFLRDDLKPYFEINSTETVALPLKFGPFVRRSILALRLISSQFRAYGNLISSGSRGEWNAREPISVQQCIEPLIEFLNLYNGGIFRSNIPNDLFWPLDPDMLIPVLFNLLENSRKHNSTIPELQVDLNVGIDLSRCNGDGALRITIYDNGKGIDPVSEQRILQAARLPQRRLENIGLAIVCCIVETMARGEVIYNRMPKGACFDLYFPRKRAED